MVRGQGVNSQLFLNTFQPNDIRLNTPHLTQRQTIQTVGTAHDLRFITDDNVARATKEARGMRSFGTLTPCIFLPLYKAFIRPHLEYAVQAFPLPILSWTCQALESLQELAVKFVKKLHHVPLRRFRLLPLVCRKICGYLICVYKRMHAGFGAPTHIGIRGHTIKIHQ